MGAIPQQVAECDKHGLFPIFGCELYVNQMQIKAHNRADSAELRKSLGNGSKEVTPLQKKFDKSRHLLAIAYNNVGYQNLVRLTSWAWIYGYYKHPRVNHDVLKQYSEGIVFTSTCANSEIAGAFFEGGDDAGFEMIERYLAMFGDKFYLELMMLDFKDQKPYDAFLIRAHDKYHIPLILSQDCFVAGTLVLTEAGFKKIEDIIEGDKVFTHKNRWQEVEIVGSRPLKQNEFVYQVSTEAGTIAYEATGNHEIYVAENKQNKWEKSWLRTDKLVAGKHYLTMPKISENDVFATCGPVEINLRNFLDPEDYQIGSDYKSSNKGNMGCKLQFNEETKEFWSYRGWDRKFKTTIPEKLPVDDDFLKILGWFIAEGWSEKLSNQVGFALHIDEQNVADWIINYFAQFNIEAKSYKVSENGIAVRFSSVVFNRLFGKMCGYGSNNKHLPAINKTWMKTWTKKQMSTILRCFWYGDGFNTYKSEGVVFPSTSKSLIHEIACVFQSLGVISLPCREKGRKQTWADKYSVTFSGERGVQAVRFLNTGECLPCLHKNTEEDLDHYFVPVKTVNQLSRIDQLVYCFRVKEDHSFTAGFYAVSNCHYCKKEHSHNQRLMLMQRAKYTLEELEIMKQSGEAEDLFELQDENLWLKSEDELNEMWETKFQDTIDYELFKQSKANTVKLAEFAKGVQIDREIKLPQLPNADVVLWEEIKRGFVDRHCPRTPQYSKRIKEEYDLITEKGFASYFLIQKMMTDEARRKGPELLGFGDGSEAVGPGRGSVCGSLVAYVLRLHDLDPIIHDLRFSRFLSPARGGKQMKIRHALKPIPQTPTVLV